MDVICNAMGEILSVLTMVLQEKVPVCDAETLLQGLHSVLTILMIINIQQTSVKTQLVKSE